MFVGFDCGQYDVGFHTAQVCGKDTFREIQVAVLVREIRPQCVFGVGFFQGFLQPSPEDSEDVIMAVSP